MKLSFSIFYLSLFLKTVLMTEDYYELLGVAKDAGAKEIRQAFKKLALKLHPDKNKEEGAHEKFLKINRAYEVLKDENSRKKYDMHGDDMDNQNQRHYESWRYYQEDFGIYDDDPEIVTLEWAEFKRSVLESHDIWFVNFYSPRCGHCHDLAPTWRSIAKQLEGVVRIGAVNCQDNFMLCRNQGITGYPSLNIYTYDEGTKKFHGPKEEEKLISFILQHLPDKVIELWEGNFESWASVEGNVKEPWLVIFCDEEYDCPDDNSKQLIGNALNGLVTFGMVYCQQDPSVCQKLRREGEEGNVIFFPEGLNKVKGKNLQVSSQDHKEISVMVLLLLPEATKLDEVAFAEMKKRLKKEIGPSWLVQFVNGNNGDDLSFKKLPALMPRLRIGQVNCKTDRSICIDHYITKYPSFIMFKLGGGFEVNYGRNTVSDVASFARISSQARTMQTLTTKDFPSILTSGDFIFVDFFAPWCPPCMNLLPEFRKASSIIGGSITFGTVDCTIHHRVCNQHNINSYPTTIFFNRSQPHKYSGEHDAIQLSDFVMEILRPTVISLTKDSFEEQVGRKPEGEVWLVDFYAPWCGPCQQLAPEWRSLAKMLSNMSHVHIGQLDCTKEADICFNQGVQGYPTIRMYPMNSKGTAKYIPYKDQRRDAESLRKWVLGNLPSNVENLTPFSFKHSVLGSNQPWLVEFYAPWCGHCVQFAPKYEQIAVNLKEVAKVGKVNCEKYSGLCSRMGIQGYPTIKLYKGSQEDEDYYSEEVNSRNPANIVSFVEQEVNKSSVSEEKEYKHDEL